MPRSVPAALLAVLLAVLSVPSARAQAPLLNLSAGHLQFTLGSGDNARLTVRGLPVFRRSKLYIVQPGWAGVHLNQDAMTPTVETAREGDAQVGIAIYKNDKAFARYRFEVRPDDTFRMRLSYGTYGEPAAVEYNAAFLNAALLAGNAFTADTVEGPRQGVVPLTAASGDQEKSRVTPFFRRFTVKTPVGPMTISVEGSNAANSSLNLFDTRKSDAWWARESPVFWLGIGSPIRTMAPGVNTVTITYAFGKPAGHTVIPVAAGRPKVVPLSAARVPYARDLPLVPRPKSVQANGARPFRVGAKTRIALGENPSEEEKRAARELQGEMKTFWGVSVPIVRSVGPLKDAITLSLLSGTSGDDEARAHPEGYTLDVRDGSVAIRGADARGVYYGAQTVKQLIRVDENGVYIKPVTIRDWPSLAMRGVHWFGGPNAWPFHQRMIDRIIAPLKLNTMVYQVDYTQWATQPKIWNPERSTPKADVKKAVDDARAHFIEPIPMVNGMGHAEWLFGNDNNLDIAADPTHPYAYNPENPRTYDVLFGLYQEAIDLFHPKYFHIGNDEITWAGEFPAHGSKKTLTDLIIADTNRRHDWLKAHGIRTMMWGDMFLDKDEANDYGAAGSPAEAKRRRAGVPHDIVIADWHYTGSDPDFKSIGVLQKEGFSVFGTSWANSANIRNFAADLAKYNSLGLLQSTWAGYQMYPDIVYGPEAGQFAAYVLAAEQAWNGGAVSNETLGYDPQELFLSLWERGPATAAPGFSVDLSPVANAAMWAWEPGGSRTRTGASAPAMPAPGIHTFAGTTFRVGRPVWLSGAMNPAGTWPESVAIPLASRRAADLVFLWGTTHAAERGTVVARLRVTYADGARREAPIRYGVEIHAFDDTSAAARAAAAWRGTSASGAPVALGRWTWGNPAPARPIRSVEVVSNGTEAAPVLVALTGIDPAARR